MNLTTQREKIIKLLQDAGDRGVTSYSFTYDYQIKQCPTRVFELKKLGFNIISKPFKNSVRYILSSRPKDEVVVPQKGIAEIIGEQMDNQVRVVKNGRIYWEDKIDPEQQNFM